MIQEVVYFAVLETLHGMVLRGGSEQKAEQRVPSLGGMMGSTEDSESILTALTDFRPP